MIVRAVVLLLAAICLAWAALVGPPAVGAYAMSKLGARVADGESFRSQALEEMLEAPPQPIAGIDCYAADLRGRMLVSARLAELALDGLQTQLVPARLTLARESARRLLACDPYDSQGWLALYWATGNLEGFGGKVFDLLVMSYRTGPREGWISFRRNPQAVFAFGELSVEMQELITREWARLVADWQQMPAAVALERATSETRLRLLSERARISDSSWIGFARFLERRGSPIELPGVPEPRR